MTIVVTKWLTIEDEELNTSYVLLKKNEQDCWYPIGYVAPFINPYTDVENFKAVPLFAPGEVNKTPWVVSLTVDGAKAALVEMT